ncbi:MAG: hypothetical protein EBX52_07735 [Proteobacteria bacterium]|nr:hypothetical protein [Pseudomonadota bacterium]
MLESAPGLNVVLIEPEIPQNTGSIGRLCLATGARLHLVKPLGFSIDAQALKRAGLDYWEHLDVVVHDSSDAFFESLPADTPLTLIETRAGPTLYDVAFEPGQYLVFGKETTGLADWILNRFPARQARIPMMHAKVRSLNLSNAVGICVYEALRQIRGGKFLIWLLASMLTLASPARAEPGHGLTIRWLGVAGVSLTDGESTLLFDPVFTKPSLRHWILGSALRSDPERVASSLKSAGVSHAEAVFASHGHFDHSVDVARVSSFTGATIYGGISLKRITTADPALPVHFQMITPEVPIRIGKFTVIPYRREHAPILHGIHWKFLPGEVPADFHFEFYGYREGETWGYRIEHPEGNVLIDQGSHSYAPNLKYSGNTDAYLVGVANKKSFEDLVEKNIGGIRAPLVVPLHFDFFFLQSETLEAMRLPSTELDRIGTTLSHLFPATRFIAPVKFSPIPVPKHGPENTNTRQNNSKVSSNSRR